MFRAVEAALLGMTLTKKLNHWDISRSLCHLFKCPLCGGYLDARDKGRVKIGRSKFASCERPPEGTTTLVVLLTHPDVPSHEANGDSCCPQNPILDGKAIDLMHQTLHDCLPLFGES
jgi:hypothetical protein